MKFFPTRIQHLADAAPGMVMLDENGRYTVAIGSDQKVHEVMGVIRVLTADWSIENRGELELEDWERLPDKEVTNG